MVILKKCQICNSKLYKFLDLGKQPLCDDLIPLNSKKKTKLINLSYCFVKNVLQYFTNIR